MEVAEGFEANYSMINTEENIARITIARTGGTEATGETALVSLPIRTWELPCLVCDGGTNKKGQYATYEFFKKGSETWPIDIQVTVVSGVINGETTFAGDTVQVDTESHVWDNATKPAEYATWNGGHDHRAWTKDYYSESSTNHVDAVALEDKAATCTEVGYTGRTYCEVCSSVVDWGTILPASGHVYDFVDGVLKCTHDGCDNLYNGVYTDGVTYADGLVADGWVGDSYYVDGVKLTGIQLVEGYYYDFGEEGVCIGRSKYTGFLAKNDGWYYITIGTEAKGWQYIDGSYYYFDPDTGLSWYGKPYYIYDQTLGNSALQLWLDNAVPRGYQVLLAVLRIVT